MLFLLMGFALYIWTCYLIFDLANLFNDTSNKINRIIIAIIGGIILLLFVAVIIFIFTAIYWALKYTSIACIYIFVACKDKVKNIRHFYGQSKDKYDKYQQELKLEAGTYKNHANE